MRRLLEVIEAIRSGAINIGVGLTAERLRRKLNVSERILRALDEDLPAYGDYASPAQPQQLMPREHATALLALGLIGARSCRDEMEIVDRAAQICVAWVKALEQLNPGVTW